MRAGLVGQEHGTPRSEVQVLCIQGTLVVGGKVIDLGEPSTGGGEFDDTVSVIAPSGVGIECAVADGDIKVALGISRDASASHPDTAFLAIWRAIPNRSE